MSDVFIKVEKLTKVFKLYEHPKDRLKEALSPYRKNYHKNYIALNEVSFEIRKGDSVGILGRNGAGKSTLLKLLTGVLTPTSGVVSVKGRIAALLELGSGFNPELSGIENIYFQGAIIGFTKEEMLLKIADIIEFADIGEFINQPVKTYSSGMFARLAFSVAINVDPDILIIDEALSVGDFAFQQKCFRRLKELKNEQKIIIFVSHDINAVQSFCNLALYLNLGAVCAYGPSSDVVKLYFSHLDVSGKSIKPSSLELGHTKAFGLGKAEIDFFSAACINNESFIPGEACSLHFEIICHEKIETLGVGITIKDKLGNDVAYINNYMYGYKIPSIEGNTRMKIEFLFSFPNIANGKYSISPAVCEGDFGVHKQQHWIYDAQTIEVYSEKYPYSFGGLVVVPEMKISINKELSQMSKEIM